MSQKPSGGNGGGNGKLPRTSRHPEIVRMHETLDEIERFLAEDSGCEPESFGELMQQAQSEHHGLSASVESIALAHGERRRRAAQG
jgi:hypothetical protein